MMIIINKIKSSLTDLFNNYCCADADAEITRACTWAMPRVVYMCGTLRISLVAVLLITGSRTKEETAASHAVSNSRSPNDVIIVATAASSSVPGNHPYLHCDTTDYTENKIRMPLLSSLGLAKKSY